MKCEQVKESLSAYLDSQLALEERHAIATHLQTCTECSNTLADFCYLDALLSRLPRVAPDASLRQRIFSSVEYKEITGTFNLSASVSDLTVPTRRVRLYDPTRPYLVALPGGHLGQPTSPAFPIHRPIPLSRYIFYRRINDLRAMHLLIAAILLLTIGVSGFVAVHLWRNYGTVAHNSAGFTPPEGLSQGPLSAGMRFVFLRDGALWSAPADGSNGIVRLTPVNSIIAANWSVMPVFPGHEVGNMLAYIDLQHALLLWSPDGQRLAYSTGTHILVGNMQTTKASRPLSIQGLATALSWFASLPNQLVIALSDRQQGIYLVDTQHDTSLQLDSSNARSPILWTQIP